MSAGALRAAFGGALLRPFGVSFEPDAAIELRQLPVTLTRIEAHGSMQLSEFDGADVQWLAVGLFEVVRAVHQAAEMHAMVDPEHMSEFVSHDFECAP